MVHNRSESAELGRLVNDIEPESEREAEDVRDETSSTSSDLKSFSMGASFQLGLIYCDCRCSRSACECSG